MKTTSRIQKLWLPTALSVNNLFREAGYGADSKTRGRIKTAEYESWRLRAAQELALQKPMRHEGKVILDFFHGLKSPLADASNYLKGAEDLLVSQGIIEGDSAKIVQKISSCWVPNFIGCAVHITPFDESAPPYLGFDDGLLGQVGASPLSAFIKVPQTLGKARRKSESS